MIILVIIFWIFKTYMKMAMKGTWLRNRWRRFIPMFLSFVWHAYKHPLKKLSMCLDATSLWTFPRIAYGVCCPMIIMNVV